MTTQSPLEQAQARPWPRWARIAAMVEDTLAVIGLMASAYAMGKGFDGWGLWLPVAFLVCMSEVAWTFFKIHTGRPFYVSH